MASQPDSLCFTDAPPIAAEVARGVTRLFCRQDLFAVCEMPLPNGRRADLMAIDAKGGLTIVEIKVARADLLGDGKWFDYLDYCDRFFWAVPPHLAKILEEERYLPGEAGLIVADRYDAAVVREAAMSGVSPPLPAMLGSAPWLSRNPVHCSSRRATAMISPVLPSPSLASTSPLAA